MFRPLLVLAVLVIAPPNDPPTDPVPQFPEAASAPLQRVIRRFDFEEAETARLQFPRHFKRNIAEDRGLPPFGAMTLTDRVAASGRWSFHFALDGGSLSAQTPTGVIPILALADYVVTANVRTSGLTHARAQVVATLYDADGRPLPGSRRASDSLRTAGRWTPISVHIPGDWSRAADLVVELQLTQPAAPEADAPPGRPLLQDVTGDAWFDDVTIWHLPRIDLALAGPSNVITQPAEPTLDILVRDLSSEPLMAELRVLDVHGAVVYEAAFPAPRGRNPISKALPVWKCGWYRAELTVRGRGRVGPTGRQSLDFAILPEDPRRSGRLEHPLAVVLPYVPDEELATVAPLVRALHVGGAVVSVWEEQASVKPSRGRFSATRDMIESLLTSDTEVTFALEGVPRDLAGELGIDPSQVLELFGHEPDAWRHHLDDMLINFGLRVSRWQLGSVRHPDAFWKPDLERLTAQATTALSKYIGDPTIVLPFTAEQEVPGIAAAPGLNVLVPYEIAPENLPTYAAPWLADGRSVFTEFELLPDPFEPRQQAIDLALRTLHGWRAGLPRMAIAAPWRWDERAPGKPVPEPAYAVWRGLADALRDRHFVGELSLGDGVSCWLMAGESPDDGALVAWRASRSRAEPAIERLVLGERPVRIIDIFGNTREQPPQDGAHDIPIGDMPVFVDGIDLSLALFRAAFAIEPSFIPTKHQMHEAAIVLYNPWNEGIAGTVRLRDVPGMHLSPRRHDFVVAPGQTVRLPLDVVLERGIPAGPKRIEADVNLKASQDYRMVAHTDVEVGWQHIGLRATWGLSRNAETGEREIVVTQFITNRGDRPVNLDAFALAPGVRQNRRIIAALPPGATAVKVFHLPGLERLAGQKIRVGVSQRDGIAQLNQILDIPAFLNEDGEMVPPVSASVPAAGR